MHGLHGCIGVFFFGFGPHFSEQPFLKNQKLPFVLTELLGTIFTAQVFILLFGKSLGMEMHLNFPVYEQNAGERKQTVCVETWDEDKGCKHHRVIPVVNTAGRTAFVLEKPCLERTEKEDTDHIADRIEEADQKENSLVDPMEEIRRADRAVEPKPSESHRRR